NSSNQLISGAGVNFTSTSGGIQTVQTAAGSASATPIPAGVTDANGVAQASLSTPGDPTNRSITVTAMSGSTTATIAVSVVGTKLTVTGTNSLILNAMASYTI